MLQQFTLLGVALLLALVIGVGSGLWWEHRGPDDMFSRMFPSLQAQRDAAVLEEASLSTALRAQTASLVAVAARGRQVVAVQEPGVRVYVQALPAVRTRLAVLAAAAAPKAGGPVQVGGGPMECAKILAIDEAFVGTLGAEN